MDTHVNALISRQEGLTQLVGVLDHLDGLLGGLLGSNIRAKSRYRRLVDPSGRDLLLTANGRGYFADANWDALVSRFAQKYGITDISGGLSLKRVDFAGNREDMYVSQKFLEFVNKEFEKEKRSRASSVMGDDDQTGNHRDGPPRKPARVPRV